MQDLFFHAGAALVMGLLIGLEREYSQHKHTGEPFAGVRTFPLFALAGYVGGLLAAEQDSPWMLVSILVIVGGLLVVSHTVSALHGKTGMTTEIAAVITTLVGALCFWDYLPLAAAVTVVVTVLLSLKPQMHSLVRNLTREDIFATLKFAIISVIVLPVLPDQTYGPLNVLNPYKIWLMVVFISGISFLGYVLIKILDPRQGIGLTGLLGGLASSTAVTMSFAQRSKGSDAPVRPLAMGIMLSWTVMFIRLAVVVGTLHSSLLNTLWLPLLVSFLVGAGYCAYLYVRGQSRESTAVNFSNPFELGPAIKFGLLYTLAGFVAKASQQYLGNAGVYLSSVVAGSTDVDAITLSLIDLTRTATAIDLTTASRGIILAAMANTIVKGGIVISAGSRQLRRILLPGLALLLISSIGAAFIF
ncbi:MAG: MgtC/SapB family protein [Anaerolineae bacterium]|nr:MgtC/SapB family protein [Anaerolineae bacterium]